MESNSRQTPTADATSNSAMVTTPHWLATEAGARVLRDGGNAIEALVAAGAALSVVYPHFCGLGGDAIWIVSDEAGNATTFLGIGQAAQDFPEMGSIPVRGPRSTLTTACLIDSWQHALDHSEKHWNGRHKLGNLLEEAICLAEDGFDVSASQGFWYQFRQSELAGWPGFSAVFTASGRQRQPGLAASLRAIADNGTREFYEGALARRIAAGLSAVGSPLTAADLAQTRTRVEPPLSLRYRDMTLLAPPPPTQGVTTLGIMGILNHFDMSALDHEDPEFYHHLVEAVKRAFGDRHSIADPDFNRVATDRLLDTARLQAKASSINPDGALPWPHNFRHGDTSFLGATDSRGRSVSMLQSIYFDWGSGVVAGDTGILWQNRGAAFNLDPASPNCLAGGKRPFYTLNPGMALRNGKPHLVYGTQGADGQPQTLALLLSLLIDHQLDPLDALSRPRFLLGKTFSDSRDSLKIEENAGEDMISRLSDMGHEISAIDTFSPLGGQAGIIRIDDDDVKGAHDPRSDGGAIGI